MSFFNLNRGAAPSANAPAVGQPESMDVIRKRAKHRLIGAAVLVLVGVVGFPLLFDAQPRPVAVDIPIEIPGKNTVKPLTLPPKSQAAAPAPAKSELKPEVKPEVKAEAKPEAKAAAGAKTEKTAKVEKTDKITAAASLGSEEEIVADKKAAAPVTSAPAAIKKEAEKKDAEKLAKAEIKSLAKPEPKIEAKADAKSDDGTRARALLDGQGGGAAAAAAAAASERMIVQVGAFADADKAKEVRQKLEKAGLKTYTQVAETKDGQRTRVRIGPFTSKAEAEKAASKIKALDLPASILAL
jgi:DedD protein